MIHEKIGQDNNIFQVTKSEETPSPSVTTTDKNASPNVILHPQSNAASDH